MFQLKILYLLIVVCRAVGVQTICIFPSDQNLLRNSDCVSLESLFKEQAWSPGTSARFSVGIYSLSNNSTTHSILVRDTSNISLLGDAFGPTVIDCVGRLGFAFINVTNLTIANIKFMQCGASVNVQINSITPGTKAAHFLVNTHRLLMINVIISYSPGYGLLCVNLHGESHIVKTNFSLNGIESDHEGLEGGSIFLLYHEGGTMCPSETTWISISNNSFDNSFTLHHRYSHTKASCLVAVIKQTCCFVRVSVSQSVFTNNLVPVVSIHDLNMSVSYEIEMQRLNVTNLVKYTKDPRRIIATVMYISSKDNSTSKENLCLSGNKTRVRDISIYDCVFNDAQFEGETDFGYIHITLFLYINITIDNCVFLPRIAQPAILIWPASIYPGTFISIDKCLFVGLQYGAVSISYIEQESLNIKIINSIFSNISSTALTVTKRLPDPNDQISLLIENTTFIHNNAYSLYASQIINITLANNKFIENDDTPILCKGSRIYFSGTTYIVGNKGYDGGALHLSAAIFLHTLSNKWEVISPILYLYPDARLILKNNKASNKGGAIYVDTGSLYNNLYFNNKKRYNIMERNDFMYYEPCFYQLISVSKLVEVRQKKVFISHVPKIIFINNTAGFAGNSIFGGLHANCDFKIPLRNKIRFENLINISHQLSLSEMAGDPNMICLCVGSVANCDQRVLYTSAYQSQSIRIYAIASRFKNHYANYGATPAVISTQIDQSEFDACVGKGQSAHKLDNKCSEILFSIYTTEQFVEVTISLSGESITLFTSLWVQVALLGCPFGFQLEESVYPGCICDSIVKESGCSCSIDKLTISCPFGKWIGNISNKTIVHHHCLFDYCIPESDIRVTHALDDQCKHNRSGILCGGCQPGFSLMLGNSKCADCSSIPLLLIAVFALAGLTLVLLLYGCNLTVSRGTINGLIYFSNVVQVNGSIFVTQNTPQFFVVFVSWLNLDLGIQTCFYNGMDMYAKAWLQFVFPVYMWLIVAIIVQCTIC